MATNSYLIETDSLQIRVSSDALIPTRCRSKKERLFFVQLRFEIKKNLYKDSLVAELDAINKLICNNGTIEIMGNNRNNDNSKTVLVIKQNSYYLIKRSVKFFQLEYKFDYKNSEYFNYSKHSLRIDLGKLRIAERSVPTTKICGYLELRK